MDVSGHQHQQNRKCRAELEALGFALLVTTDRYAVRYKGVWIGSAGVMSPREAPLHWRHREANLRDNLNSAILVAERRVNAAAPATPPDSPQPAPPKHDRSALPYCIGH